MTIKQFITRLKNANISHLWDTRDAVISRYKQDFKGVNLERFITDAGIVYEYKKVLGVPKIVRDALLKTNITQDEFNPLYEKHLIDTGVNLETFKAELKNIDVLALYCSCDLKTKPCVCHRRSLAALLGSPDCKDLIA